MNHVTQSNAYDCGVACLEMLTGLHSAEIYRRLGYRCAESDPPRLCFGVLSEEAVMILHQVGLCPMYVRTRADLEEEARQFDPDNIHAHILRTADRRRLLPDHTDVLTLAAGKRAMLAVHLPASEQGHFVAWDRYRVLDPHPSREVEADAFQRWEIRSAIICLREDSAETHEP